MQCPIWVLSVQTSGSFMNINLTLIAAAIVFAIFLFVMMRFIWPPLMNAIEARQKKIAEGLAAADRGQSRLRDAESEAQDILRKARSEAGEIVGQAERQGQLVVNAAKIQAKEEADRIVAGARSSLAVEITQAKSALQANVASLALATASQILGREVNAANHDQLLTQIQGRL